MTTGALLGGIEAGGTKFMCMVGNGPASIVEEIRIETASPDSTLGRVFAFFRPYCEAGQVQRIGVGSFGPLDLDHESPTYGCITTTPKPGWQNTNLVGAIEAALPVRVILDTDVNAAALAEYSWGAGIGVNPLLYVTIGTGIGGSLLQEGKPLSGLRHPEMGHISIAREFALDSFPGICPFHADCFEGLASGPSIAARLGTPAENVGSDHPFWDVEATYIAQALATYVLILSPKKIVLGGGVMRREFLLPKIRVRLQRALAGYLRSELLIQHIDGYVVPPDLGASAGVFGALALAERMS